MTCEFLDKLREKIAGANNHTAQLPPYNGLQKELLGKEKRHKLFEEFHKDRGYEALSAGSQPVQALGPHEPGPVNAVFKCTGLNSVSGSSHLYSYFKESVCGLLYSVFHVV